MFRQSTHCVILGAVVIATFGCAATPVAPTPDSGSDLTAALQSLSNADSALVSINQPGECCPKQNLPQFLGVECVCRGVQGLVNGIRNRLGMAFPGLEAKPPLLAITDPANMSEDSPPAVKAAAEIKAQEDQAAQKIKAIRYLATIGCGGCYPDVEDALIAAMEDCTEEVRYEAVLAVRKTAGKTCVYCSCDSCCSEKVQKKLRELANGQGCPCCVGEQSARIRRHARLALQACGPPVIVEEPEPVEPPEPIETPTEGPEEGAPEEGETPAEGGDEEEPAEELAEPDAQVATAAPKAAWWSPAALLPSILPPVTPGPPQNEQTNTPAEVAPAPASRGISAVDDAERSIAAFDAAAGPRALAPPTMARQAPAPNTPMLTAPAPISPLYAR